MKKQHKSGYNEKPNCGKRKTAEKPTALSGCHYLYHANQLVAEVPLQTRQDDFTPTARYQNGQLHYTVADQVGMITELVTEDGHIDYRQKLNLWGEAEIDGYRHHADNDSAPLSCNHRFVGQYYDDESGLHYNRFRYYSPKTGQYISHDPIGLLDGFNPYGYVFNPTGWIDPMGLARCNKPGGYETGDVDPHGFLSPQKNRAPGHANISADGFIQSHYPIQDAWARQHINGYNRNQAPATLLHSASGEPHAQISAAQRARRTQPGDGIQH